MPVHRARLHRALDRRLLGPILGAYCLSYIDRANLSNALTSLERSLGLTPTAFSLASALFTAALVSVEVPSNLAVQRFGARTWITVLLFGCGMSTLLQAFVSTWPALIVVRTLLGCFEGGVFPGLLYVLTFFYSPQALVLRISFFTLAASLANALGSVLASILLPLDPDLGWRSLFLLQGGATLLGAAYLQHRLPRDEDDSDFLPVELRSVLNRERMAIKLAEAGHQDPTLKQTVAFPNETSHGITLSTSPSLGPLKSLPIIEPRFPSIDSPSPSPSSSSSTSSTTHHAHAHSRTPLLPSNKFNTHRFLGFFPITPTTRTLLSPLTLILALGYLLILLSTTPSAFLPRLLQSRWALHESEANALVGLTHALGGIIQLGVGFWASQSGSGSGEKKGRAEGTERVWRRLAGGVVCIWAGVAWWEASVMMGEGVDGAMSLLDGSGGGGTTSWVGTPSSRWAGVSLRVAATMATPTLGPLYLARLVSVPASLEPHKGTLTAAVVAFGNLAQALGPPLYARAIPVLVSPSPSPPLDFLASSSPGEAAGYPLWSALAHRDALMAGAVAGGWAAFEVVGWCIRRHKAGGRGGHGVAAPPAMEGGCRAGGAVVGPASSAASSSSDCRVAGGMAVVGGAAAFQGGT